jgi:hypothetical protein
MFSLKYKKYIKYSHIYDATVIKRMFPSYCTVCCLYRCVAIICCLRFLATLLYLRGCGVPISYSHVLHFLVVM